MKKELPVSHSKHLFEFATKLENFESIYILSEAIPNIKKQLINDFWYELKNKIDTRLSKESKKYKGWKSKMSENAFEYHSYLGVGSDLYFSIQKGEFTSMITFEMLSTRSDIGVWFNKDIPKMNRNYKMALNDVKPLIKRGYFIGTNDETYPAYKKMEEDFTTLEGLIKLLPENRDSLVKTYLEEFFTVFDDLIGLIKKYGK